jgi:tetratricopeptide (TPR) repeat protein
MTGLRRIGWTHALIALVAVFFLVLPAVARASAPLATVDAAAAAAPAVAAASSQEIATLEAASGQVMVVRLGQSQPPLPSMPLQLNDIVVTKQGRATVRFHSDGTVVRVGPDSRVQINESAKERDITVFFGRLWAHVVRWKERPTRFSSSSTIAAMRGTEVTLAVAVDGNETQVSVLEGRVQAQTDAGSLMLVGGQVAVGSKGKAPVRAVQVRPKDAVQWALYYLPVIDIKPGELGEGAAWQGKVRESAEAYVKGDLGRAIESLQGIAAQDMKDPRFFTYRASLLLAAGGVEEAGKDIEHALALAANDADALALQAIVAVANNEADKALGTARRAVAADPKSATAQIALSYARQAKFDLEGARESLETAVRIKPDDALAWARLAEIRSSLGHLGEALEAAKKAVGLQPNLARTQTVLGYTYLTQVKTREATEAFKKAIALDQSDPLPRLGLGLAEIREGHLTEGSKEIEVAVSLDPQQALVRSYLGKAYFEAKRAGLVQREYDVAKQADPKDPTPWLYDAIDKQTTNRPVEALEDVQKAIELNDNRAVYRSRLLLDSDLAARSASLGRIFNDLGFQDVGLVEGWSSVNTDPSDYSGHRLLADNYAALPRHEIARVSELFQSQMLQPLNTTPIQPSLGESNLFLISSQGPGTLAFNEFNPLFNRNQLNVQGGFMLGEDKTWSGEGIASGIYDKASFSAGYSAFKTDGFRANDDQDDKIANAFAQFELGPSTSVQGEVRYRKLNTGDLGLRFYDEDFNTLESDNDKATSLRVGLRQDFGPGLTLLGSYMHQKNDIGSSVPTPDLGYNFGLTRNDKADSVEGQFLFRSSRFKLVGGGGYFDIHSKETVVIDFLVPDIPEPVATTTTITDGKTAHTNLYAYSYVSLPENVTLTLGVSGDLFNETGTAVQNLVIPDVPAGEPAPYPADVVGKKNQANPKAGILWRGKSGTTLRAAVFRTLKRTLITDQTLEPTQVAGFNQFFDDPSATRSWVYGAAIDQKFGKKVFGGVEFSARDLTIPHTLFESAENGLTNLVVEQWDGSERLARTYLFAAPHPWVTLSAEYQYEDLKADPNLFLSYSEAKNHWVPLSVRFFHPSGIGASLSTTYLHQSGEFRIPNDPNNALAPGTKDFWVVDAALRYRLPKRYGFIAVGVNNLTDERSSYDANAFTDAKNYRIRPGRLFYGRVVLAFP